jgi:hypothetical protein
MTVPVPKPAPLRITAQPGSLLASLLDQRDAARAALDDAEARMEALTAEIKNAVTAAAGARDTDIFSAGRPPLRLAWRVRRTFARKDFDRDHPGLYEAYLAPGKGFWELRALDGR